MMIRIDRARIPQGLIRNAKSYMLILNDEGLYVLHVGPARGMEVSTKNVIERGAVNFALKRLERKIAEGEERLSRSLLDEWAAGKRSAFYRVGEVENAVVDANYANEPRLTIYAKGKKWKLIIPQEAVDMAQDLVAQLNARS